ncbi:MAG: hypothetical protein QW331_03830 [Candidatus Woesearchaeota archaeon]
MLKRLQKKQDTESIKLQTRKPKWDEAVKKGILHKDIQIIEREGNALAGLRDFFRRYFSAWVIVLIVSIFLYVYKFSWEELQKSLLAWFIGASLVAILTTMFLEWKKRRL